MPKLIDYPRTNYTGAWELAEVVDDTGGKCAIDTAARKLNRKVSGSFKAIIGSAVKFGLMTSKRELLSTTTLFKRIKHAYDKQEELQFHREAFLTPPLFTQICRKFRGRELPVQMLDVMLIREFGVEEINAQGVAKAFVEGSRMCGILDDHNIMADIDALNAQRLPRRELASPMPDKNLLAQQPALSNTPIQETSPIAGLQLDKLFEPKRPNAEVTALHAGNDAIADLFGISERDELIHDAPIVAERPRNLDEHKAESTAAKPHSTLENDITVSDGKLLNEFRLQIMGPGVNTSLDITDEEDITIAIALLEKIRRQLRGNRMLNS